MGAALNSGGGVFMVGPCDFPTSPGLDPLPLPEPESPPGLGVPFCIADAFTRTDQALCAVAPCVSRAVSTTLKLPARVGVPLNRPVRPSMVMPSGKPVAV